MKLINRFLFLFKTGRERVGAQAAQPKSNPPFLLLAHWPQLAPPGSNFRRGGGGGRVASVSSGPHRDTAHRSAPDLVGLTSRARHGAGPKE